MAYTLMAGLPVVHGLYTTFFAIFIYIFLGSSRHAAAGVYGVVALLVGNCVSKNAGILYPSGPLSNTTDTSAFISTDSTTAKIMIGSALGFYSGIFLVLFLI
jgi:MFS superfamily sulfate permease-like transporter